MAVSWGARLGVLLTAAALVAGLGSVASAAGGGGESTPGVTVTAQNPGTSSAGSDLRITLTAHSEESTVAAPDCRPTDPNLRCWGSLMLRIPGAGGLTLQGLEVHRVAVGNTSCGGCGGEMTSAAILGDSAPVQAQVNGLSTITDPGTAQCWLLDGQGQPTTQRVPCVAGTRVQVLMTLTDKGPAHYGDTITIDVNQFVSGPNKPTIWETSEPQLLQQVQIHGYSN